MNRIFTTLVIASLVGCVGQAEASQFAAKLFLSNAIKVAVQTIAKKRFDLKSCGEVIKATFNTNNSKGIKNNAMSPKMGAYLFIRTDAGMETVEISNYGNDKQFLKTIEGSLPSMFSIDGMLAVTIKVTPDMVTCAETMGFKQNAQGELTMSNAQWKQEQYNKMLDRLHDYDLTESYSADM